MKSYNTSTSAYDITELVEPFTLDGSGYASDMLVYDKAGNMTYDGLQQYAYDGWNRLRTVAHAYRDSSSVLHAGQVFVTHSYDGKGRRITKDVRDAGGLGDGVWRWYYDNDSVIEVRDGGFQPAKQYVWGTRYVDELVQVMSQMVLGLDPMDLDPDYVLTGETTYHYDSSGARGSAYTGIYTIGKPMWACQDANYNVLGVINGDGVLRERYTYTPYGERQAFRSAGAADVGDFSPLFASDREAFGSDPYNNFPLSYGVCDVGHQGLIHDEENGLIYNRARVLNSEMKQFATRDAAQYNSGLNLVEYQHSQPTELLDSSGNEPDGSTSCQPWSSGDPIVIVVNNFSCGAECTRIHEDTHETQLRSCCQKYKDEWNKPNANKAALADKWKAWIGENVDVNECEAYTADLACFNKKYKDKKCAECPETRPAWITTEQQLIDWLAWRDCCDALAADSASSIMKKNEHCTKAKGKKQTGCPF